MSYLLSQLKRYCYSFSRTNFHTGLKHLPLIEIAHQFLHNRRHGAGQHDAEKARQVPADDETEDDEKRRDTDNFFDDNRINEVVLELMEHQKSPRDEKRNRRVI